MTITITLYWVAAVVAAGALGFTLGRKTVGPDRLRVDLNLRSPNIFTHHVTVWRGQRVLFHADRARTGSWRITERRFLNTPASGVPGCSCNVFEVMTGDVRPGCPVHHPVAKLELAK